MAETVVPGLERRLKAHLLGEVQLRRVHARALCHRRLALPDHAGRRGRAALDQGGRARARARARGGRERAAARRRHLAVRPDRQCLAGHRLLEASRPHARARRRRPALRGRARHRARRAQSPAASRTGCGFRSTSRPPRAPPSAAWSATIPAARARCATATPARTCSSIDAVLADGAHAHFGPVARDLSDLPRQSPLVPLARDLLAIAAREADEIEAHFPKVQRRVGGYNLDALRARPQRSQSRAYSGRLRGHARLLHPDRAEAFAAARPARGRRLPFRQLRRRRWMRRSTSSSSARSRSSWSIAPCSGLAREIAMFQPTIDAVVRGDPEAILFVEFAEDDQDENVRRLRAAQRADGRSRLRLGQDRRANGAAWSRCSIPKLQTAITEMRTAGLNIMMSMKEEGKPISFVEDCAVPLEHLADYTSRLTDIFEKHGTRGTWYAHASVGCLHVRPVLNLRLEQGRQGDARDRRGGLRHGARLQGLAFRRARRRHRALGIPRDDVRAAAGARLRGGQGPLRSARACSIPARSCARRSSTTARSSATGRTITPTRSHARLDWSAYPGAGGGFQGAVEMCNNNGACRALAGGVMCPSYRVTRDERDVTRGRANTLRLAITGQLGPDALTSDEMARDAQALRLLQGLPARMPDRRRHGAHEDRGAGGARRQARPLAARPAGRLSAALCAVCRRAGRGSPTCATTSRGSRNGRRHMPGSARAAACRAGAAMPGASRRACPAPTMRARSCSSPTPSTAISSRRTSRPRSACSPPPATACICRSPRTAAAGRSAAGAPSWRSASSTRRGARPSAASRRSRRFVARGMPVVGLEPSCILGFRDEIPALIKSDDARALAANALLFEEFLAREAAAGTLDLPLKPVAKRALLHGHCHQKSFGAMGAIEAVLRLVPELAVETVESSCCGMAGAFGYGADTIDVSLTMARALAAAGGAQGRARYAGGGRRHLVPPSDQGRHRARGAPRRARAGDEPQSVRRRRGHLARLKQIRKVCSGFRKRSCSNKK